MMVDKEEKLVFILGDKLPTIYEVAISIYSSTNKKPNSDGMKRSIKAYVTALIDVWIKSFGEKHVISRTPITKKVEGIIKHYHTHVYLESKRTKPKHKGEVLLKKSVRQLNREWSLKFISWSKNSKEVINVSSLLDIGSNMDQLTGDEKAFYIDQKTKRNAYLSKEIDIDFVVDEEKRAEAAAAEIDIDCSMDVDEEENDVAGEEYLDNSMSISMNRSGLSRIISVDVGTQIKNLEFNKPKIRKTRDCTHQIKATCAEVSVRCNISTEQSRIAVQTVCGGLYNHQYYLTKEGAIENDPSLEIFKSNSPKPSKRSKLKEKVPA